MTTAQWIRFGLVAAAVLGALAGLAWIVGGPPGRPLAWAGGGAAVLVLAATVTARLRRPASSEAPAAPVPASVAATAPAPAAASSSAGPTDNTIAGGVSGGTVLQGRDLTVHQPTHHTVIDTQIVHSPTAEPDWPVVVGVLPNEADHFQHRELTDRLSHTAKDHPTVVLGQVLSGMGGVGKTQLAAHHARALLAKDAIDLVVWVPAAERATIVQAYADAARAVSAGHADEDPDRAALQFLTWLQTTDRRWLVVLDNLDVPEHVRGLWPPTATPSATEGSAAESASGPLGRLVVTTRRTDTALAGRGRAFIDVGTYTPAEAHTYLATALAGLPSAPDEADLAALAEDLGHLPLALSHAAAYVRDRRDSMTCASYRARLRDQRGALERMFPERESLPDDYARTVATTWSMSVEHADTLTPRGLALPMMRLLSLLDPTGVPVKALTSSPVLEYLRRAHPDRPEPTEHDADDALSALARLHLVTRSGFGDDAVVGVHRLVQRATREQRATRPDRGTARTAADALVRVWPMRVHASALGHRLRANTAALVEHAEEWLWEDGLHPVVTRFGESLGKSGALSQAVAHWTSVLDTAGARLGGDHRDTLFTRHQVVLWRGMAGEANYAAEAFAALAEEMTRILGAEDSQTMATRVQSARWLGRAGGEQSARRMMEDLLPDLMRLLGPDHPDTLTTRGHLASLRGKAGDAQAAVDTYAALLEDEHRMLGHDHPRVLLTRGMLARWRGRAKDTAAAIADFEALLPDQVRVLGPDHPDTLSTRGQIAAWRGVTGDHERALQELDALRADQLRHLGPDHPHLLTTRHSQARFLGAAGDPALAAELIADLMPDQLRILGPDHPKTHEIEADLEHWRRRAAREERGA
ncbi:tetratricopeptide repeat protein [Nocardiopsis aegyptia]|uniref:tetratricopeptide repeat protein n=1 Tax=Nocardiopsis aegyptia TaxID=220378 RepID=UPI00366DC817